MRARVVQRDRASSCSARAWCASAAARPLPQRLKSRPASSRGELAFVQCVLQWFVWMALNRGRALRVTLAFCAAVTRSFEVAWVSGSKLTALTATRGRPPATPTPDAEPTHTTNTPKNNNKATGSGAATASATSAAATPAPPCCSCTALAATLTVRTKGGRGVVVRHTGASAAAAA